MRLLPIITDGLHGNTQPIWELWQVADNLILRSGATFPDRWLENGKRIKSAAKHSVLYGKAFSKRMLGMVTSMILSGAVALFGESKQYMIASLVVLYLVFSISITVLLWVQKKYNNGLFS